MPTVQTLVVMRHAKRLDEVDSNFASTSSSWWDPPLTPQGYQEVSSVVESCKVASAHRQDCAFTCLK